MDLIQLIGILVGATGFWQLLGVFMNYQSEKKIKAAEVYKVKAQAEGQVVQNWMTWVQALEKRVKELESVAIENKALKKQIDIQRKRICELENKVNKLEKENASLLNQLNTLSKKGKHEQ